MSARPVGVVAATLPRAKALIAELGLANALPISRVSGARGLQLSALIVDDTALPLTERAREEILPALLPDGVGRVYELHRHCAPPPF